MPDNIDFELLIVGHRRLTQLLLVLPYDRIAKLDGHDQTLKLSPSTVTQLNDCLEDSTAIPILTNAKHTRLDGTHYELKISSEGGELTFRWYDELPAAWSPLNKVLSLLMGIHDQLILMNEL